MSHSTVLVIGPNVEAQLAPFDENTEVTPYPKPESLASLTRMIEHYQLDGTEAQQRLAKALLSFDADGHVPDAQLPTLKKLYKAWGEHELIVLDAPVDGCPYGYLSTYNPRSRWDWYAIGGRWTGFFKLRAGCHGKLGEPGAFSNRAPAKTADQCRKGDVDFAGMRDEAEGEAAATYDAAQVLIAGRSVTPWSAFLTRVDQKKLTLDEARDAYHTQDVVKAFAAAGRKWAFVEIEPLLAPRAEFIQYARDSATVTFAVLKDNTWFEQGTMGWFGIAANEKDDKRWAAEHAALIDALPDDALLTVVDVHI